MSHPTAFALLLLALAPTAWAAPPASSCPKLNVPEGQAPDPASCLCGTALKPLEITSPYPGLDLVAVCDYSDPDPGQGARHENAQGKFFFKGTATYTGTLRLENNPDFAWPLEFTGPGISVRPPFQDTEVSLLFSGYRSVADIARSFEASGKLVDTGRCVSAAATVRVNEIYVAIDGGSDFMGSYATRYEFLNAPAFSECSR